MDNKIEQIPVFFAVDDIYVPFLGIALQSLIDHSSENYCYMIKILHTSINDANKAKIEKMQKDNIQIEFVDLNYYIERISDKLYTRDYYTKATYFRLFVPDLYPQFDKALYLDSDIIIREDVANLYNVELGRNLVAGVPDGVVQTVDIFKDYVEKVVGVIDYNNYFNAGILVMNLKELRRFRFQEKFLYLLVTVKFAVAQDQDYLNRLCKGRAKIVDKTWNVMPRKELEIAPEDTKIIHYNLADKPWHFDNILYEEFFWECAKKTEFYNDILKIKQSYTDEQRKDDMDKGANLIMLAKKEADCVGDDRINRKITDNGGKSPERLEILEKIKELEAAGIFDKDVEDDPPTIQLKPEDIDYLKSSKMSKIKSKMATKMAERLVNDLIKDNKLIIKQINGIENLQKVQSGAIITCNQFNPYDSFTIEKVFRISGQNKKKKLYKVIREGNYTNFPGLYGFFFRNCDTLPLSSNKKTMVKFVKAINTILRRGDFVLIYPEQSMWWNYRKPKPLKNGAFNFAARSKVPVIPIFITMEDSNIIGEDGFPIQEYTVNISEPIFPSNKLNEKNNTIMLRDKNYEIWKNIYEDFYGVPLEYDIDEGVEIANK